MSNMKQKMQTLTRKNEELFDAGYQEGVRDAVEYLADLFEGVYDTEVFEVHGVVRIKETM